MSIWHRILHRFCMDFSIIFDDFFDVFSDKSENTPILPNVGFSLGKPMILKFQRIDFSMLFQCFFHPFSVLIFLWIFFDFGNHFGSISHPFSTPWHHFYIFSRLRFFHHFSGAIIARFESFLTQNL